MHKASQTKNIRYCTETRTPTSGRSVGGAFNVWGYVLVALVALLLPSCRFGSSPQPNKIGVVLALTGRGATYGQRALNGMQLGVDKLNTEEPFKSSPIQLVVEDSRSTATQALSGFRKLIDVNGVQVAIGFVLSDEVLTCAPTANERRVVLLTTAAGSDQIADAGDYIFRNRESARSQAEALAETSIKRLHLTDVATLHSTSANGLSYANDFSAAMENRGGHVTVSEPFAEGKTDYRSEIERLRTKKPKAVYLAGLDQELGLILRQAQEVGFTTQFLASPGAISQKLLDIAGLAAEGLISASATFDPESADGSVKSFVESYTAKYGTAPDFIAANSYDAVYLIASPFRQGLTAGEQIKKALYSVKNFPGVGGTMTFDSRGEVSKPISVVRVTNGKFKPY